MLQQLCSCQVGKVGRRGEESDKFKLELKAREAAVEAFPRGGRVWRGGGSAPGHEAEAGTSILGVLVTYLYRFRALIPEKECSPRMILHLGSFLGKWNSATRVPEAGADDLV